MKWINQHRTIIIISIIIAVLIIKFSLLRIALLFLLVGAIPGTSYSVPPLMMVCGTLVLLWFVAISLTYQVGQDKKTESSADSRTDNLPRRRFAR